MSEFKRLIDAAKRGDLEEVKDILRAHPEIINQRDEGGATALHHAAFGGHQTVAELLLEHGADINARDREFDATPAGWAIEYLREMGALLGIELRDFAHAIERGDVHWAERFLRRFPALLEAGDGKGNSFRQLAEESGNQDIVKLFQ